MKLCCEALGKAEAVRKVKIGTAALAEVGKASAVITKDMVQPLAHALAVTHSKNLKMNGW